MDGLPSRIHSKVLSKIQELSGNPRRPGVKKLRGGAGYRLRVGNYRVLFVVDDAGKTIEIMAVGHRKDVYR